MGASVMQCPNCRHEIPEDSRFCNKCGQELSPSAEPTPQALSFDEKIDKIQRYLPKGLTEKILAQRGKIEGERKQVTIMFCDMEGFTPLVEKLGSEKTYSIMDEIYEILIHKVHDFEGTVNEMTGDGVVALFGAPIALEDAPQRALRSALSIHSEISKFNGKRDGIDPIKMRIGVHTGPVVVGTLGNNLRVEFKAVGDTVNLASRMEGIAEPGTTYVSADTFKLTEGLFQFEDLGEKEIKGKGSTVPVFKLLSSKKDVHRPRLGIERNIYSEMVGRDKELDKLEFQVMKAIRGEGSIVNIIGEAGIGKSRLIAELKNREVMKRISLFEGRAISTGRNLSFHPIIDLLKQWARIGEDDSGAAALNKLETAIRRVLPEDLNEILPFVATLMGMKLSGRYAERVKGIEGEALEKLILKNMRDLIIRATELKPHVIVMEDLHWADMSSIELTESLYRLAETQRIVFINVFRPGYEETGDRVVETIKGRHPDYYVEIDVQPLDESMSEMLINNMLQIKGLKHTVIDQIIERADGNPFFIEEVVRSFIDHGAVVHKDGIFEVTEKIDTMVIPHTINDVLIARIDRLDEKTRELVKIASVIGRSFFYRILKEMTKTIEDVDNRLSYLQEIQLFRERKRMEEIEYLFKHALAQEAAYESILQQMRKELHLKVAESIEMVFKERLPEFYGMLAYHYSKGENIDKTEEYMIKAGEEALSSSASSEALGYYQEVLRLYLKKYGETADPEKLAMLEKNIAIALFNKGEHEDALVYLDRVLKRWGIKPPRNKILMFTKLLWDLLILTLRLYFPSKKSRKFPTQKDRDVFNLCRKKGVALVYVNPMRMFAEVVGDIKRILKFDLGKIESGYDTLFSGTGIFASTALSFRLSKKFLDYGERYIDENNFRALFQLKMHRDFHNMIFGQWDGVWGDYDSLAYENLKVGLFWEGSSYFRYGVIKVYQGEYKEGLLSLEKLLKIGNDFEYREAIRYHLLDELETSLLLRNLNDAQRTVEKYELTFKVGKDTDSMIFLGRKAELQILLNDYDEAEKSVRQAGEIFRKQDMVLPMFAGSYLWSRFLLDISFLKEAKVSNDKLKISKQKKLACISGKKLLINSKKYSVRRPGVFNLLACYHWLTGKQNKAVKFWKKAIDEGERLGTRPEVARTYMEIGKRFLEAKSKYKELDGISAEEYLEKARTMFTEMDLQWDLDELDKIVASV
jgi:class 3 adenylate cyclase/tetratricopeptide (TPR) repeat protein